MRVVYERCCGLDVHKKTVVACVLITEMSGEVQRHIRTFSTMTAGLLAAFGLVREYACPSGSHAVNGRVWETGLSSDRRRTNHHSGQCPAYAHLFLGGRRMSKMPNGARIYCVMGYSQRALSPAAPIREMRDLVRYRKSLVQERARSE